MSEKVIHAVLCHGEHSAAFPVNSLTTVDELKHFACKHWRSLSPGSIRFSYLDTHQLVFVQGDIQLQGLIALFILIKNEDFYLNVDVIQNHTSRSNSGCSTSSSSSTANSCVTDSPKMVRVADHDADQAKPTICNEWIYVFDKVGREFMGCVKAVKIAVDKYKMATGHKIIILKNDKTRFTAKCAENDFGWRIHFGPVNGDISRFVLKDSNVIHRLKSPAVTTKLVKHLIADNIQGDPSLKPRQIMSLFKKTNRSNIKYHHARREKEAVFEEQFGDDEKSYSDLSWGTLMAATCVNRDNGFYPFAFALVSYENKDNWFWFLDNLKQVVDGRQICNLPIGSGDANSKAVIYLFYKASYSYTTANFEEALRAMHAIGCGHVVNYIRTIPKEKWENAFFHICRYSAHSSTLSESFNNWILDYKKLSAFSLLYAIRLKVMKMNSTRRVEGLETFNTRLTPTFEALLKENIDIGRTWTVTESMERLYEVASPRTHSVDILQKTCTCHRWRVNGFPCAHACNAIQSTREDIYSFVEPYFTTEWYNKTYEEIILPIPNYDKAQAYDPSDRIIVPILVPPPGRRKAQRFKNAWEKQKRPMMCTKCFTLGHHNRASCPML
ncbi:uncharacterized protein LOC113337113 [Papaver somniferum]|uniref:uncharacterized protein LOC113337113 n=1 Tax=Papaver somniferum TaxID=3469 RepID=UPI000E6FE20C|nr:uncharacterized protein LOC113337113 [Papaver somniferum]